MSTTNIDSRCVDSLLSGFDKLTIHGAAEVVTEIVSEIVPDVVTDVVPTVASEVVPEVVTDIVPEIVSEIVPTVATVATVASEVVAKLTTGSKNSQTARSGFKAEEVFRTDPTVRQSLETYFGKQIVRFVKISGKKYDTVLYFADGSECRIQNKKFENTGGRGESFDRRKVSDTFDNRFLKLYLTKLLLSKEKPAERMSDEQKLDFRKLCLSHIDDVTNYVHKTLVGVGPEANELFAIMNIVDSKVRSLHVIRSDALFEYVTRDISDCLMAKQTCLHLSSSMYMQRKGGTNTDSAPNHIQIKLKLTHDLLNCCTALI